KTANLVIPCAVQRVAVRCRHGMTHLLLIAAEGKPRRREAAALLIAARGLGSRPLQSASGTARLRCGRAPFPNGMNGQAGAAPSPSKRPAQPPGAAAIAVSLPAQSR